MAENDSGKKKKVAIMGVCSVILVAMVVAVVGHVSSKSKDDSNKPEISSSMKAIEAICRPTDYKQACIDSMKSKAGNSSDPKDLVKAAFSSTVDQLTAVIKNSSLIQELNKDPRAALALKNCEELAGYAIDDLKKSFSKMVDLDYTRLDQIITDIKVWLSAVVTYQETCLDGFENTTGDAGEKMKQLLKDSMQLSSNGLAIIGGVQSILSNLQIPGINRRLLSSDNHSTNDGFPSWTRPGDRKLLQASIKDIKPNLVVAKDGSGNFKTINEALPQIPKGLNDTTFVLYIKEGIYDEQVFINKSFTNVMMVGDGPTKTRITGHLNFIDGTPTFKTATAGMPFYVPIFLNFFML